MINNLMCIELKMGYSDDDPHGLDMVTVHSVLSNTLRDAQNLC